VQDCYLRLLEQTDLQTLMHPPAFVFTVAGNLASNHMAKLSVRARYTASSEDASSVASEAPSLETHANAVNSLDTVINALERLPELCSTAFVLNRIDGMSYVAVAEHLHISEKSVERYIAKALKACKHALYKGGSASASTALRADRRIASL
jgi:RNA polymerase sigma-70 factor (ECF subfamily)